ncbi:MAG: trypsin-like peptidase domain-containing protein [archaeon]|nr:trypsin-like peptidase domain-containing protein [archaeon]
MTEAVEKLSESVVSISTVRLGRGFRFGIPVESQGSGVIIDPRGYIITNHHVIDDGDRVRIDLKDGRSFSGEVIGGDPATDIALIKVDAGNLPAAKLGDSEKLKVGQIAIAIGNSLGLPGGPTVSAGVISALGRPLPGAAFIIEGLIQTDASINPGNSGGPLADLEGNVIGINTAIVPYAQGVGFAIPINTVKRIVEQIVEKGRVMRPWLGISGTSINPAISRRYSLPTDSGVLIVQVAPESPSYEAGLRVGDILVKIGPYEIKNMTDLFAALSKLSIGEVVALSILRMGRKYETSLRLVEGPIQIMGRIRR